MTLEELMQRYGEVEFLLRSPLKSDDDVSAAFEASKASLAFIEEITQLATKSGENRGMLMRWILPYDASTSSTKNLAEFTKNKIMNASQVERLAQMEDLLDRIREKLPQIFEQQKPNKAQMSKDLGFTRPSLDNYISQGSNIKLNNLLRILAYLNVPVEDFFETPPINESEVDHLREKVKMQDYIIKRLDPNYGEK